MKDTPAVMIKVSCPVCKEMVDVDMNLEAGELPEFIRDVLGFDGYTFHGDCKCSEGHTVVATLTVAGGASDS
jgi:hypothetical protein